MSSKNFLLLLWIFSFYFFSLVIAGVERCHWLSVSWSIWFDQVRPTYGSVPSSIAASTTHHHAPALLGNGQVSCSSSPRLQSQLYFLTWLWSLQEAPCGLPLPSSPDSSPTKISLAVFCSNHTALFSWNSLCCLCHRTFAHAISSAQHTQFPFCALNPHLLFKSRLKCHFLKEDFPGLLT